MTTTAWWWNEPQPYNIVFDGTVLFRVICWMILFCIYAAPFALMMLTALITQPERGDLNDRSNANAVVDGDSRGDGDPIVSCNDRVVSTGDMGNSTTDEQHR